MGLFKLPEKAMDLTYELGYIIGVLLGDGSIIRIKENSSKYIRNSIVLQVRDKDFAEYFSNQVERWCDKKPYFFTTYNTTGFNKNRRNTYMIRLRSKEVVDFLYPKIQSFEWINIAPNDLKKGIIRGLFDSEGSILRGKRNGIKLRFSNTEKRIADLYYNLCTYFGINVKYMEKEYNHITNKIIYSIETTSQFDAYFFNKLIGITIKRKTEKISDILSHIDRRLLAYKKFIDLDKNLSYKEILNKLEDKTIKEHTICDWKRGINPTKKFSNKLFEEILDLNKHKIKDECVDSIGGKTSD